MMPATSTTVARPLLDSLIEKREAILSILRSHNGKELRVFGSVASREDSPDSDVDFLVTLEEDATLFDYMDLRRALQAFLGRHVDLVDMEALMSARSGFGFHRRDHILENAKLVCR